MSSCIASFVTVPNLRRFAGRHPPSDALPRAVRVSSLISKHQTVDAAIKAIVEAAVKQKEDDAAAGVEEPPLREGEEERIEFSAGARHATCPKSHAS